MEQPHVVFAKIEEVEDDFGNIRPCLQLMFEKDMDDVVEVASNLLDEDVATEMLSSLSEQGAIVIN